MTEAETIITKGLAAMPQKNLERLAAHMAAGLPMRYQYGWEHDGFRDFDDPPADCGCIVGVSFSSREWLAIDDRDPSGPLHQMAVGGLVRLFEEHGDPEFKKLFTTSMTRRLSYLVNMELELRHQITAPLPAASSQEAILPTLKEAVLA